MDLMFVCNGVGPSSEKDNGYDTILFQGLISPDGSVGNGLRIFAKRPHDYVVGDTYAVTLAKHPYGKSE